MSVKCFPGPLGRSPARNQRYCVCLRSVLITGKALVQAAYSIQNGSRMNSERESIPLKLVHWLSHQPWGSEKSGEKRRLERIVLSGHRAFMGAKTDFVHRAVGSSTHITTPDCGKDSRAAASILLCLLCPPSYPNLPRWSGRCKVSVPHCSQLMKAFLCSLTFVCALLTEET